MVLQVHHSIGFLKKTYWENLISSVQSKSLWPHGLQHTRPPCPSPTPRACSNSCASSQPLNHLILCHHLLLLPSIFPSLRIFSNESVLPIRWPEYWSFSFSISPSNEYSGLISFRIDWFDLFAVQFSSLQSSRSVMSNSFWPHGLQHTRLPCPSPTPGVYSNSCSLSWWFHPTISFSVIPFSACLQSFPASGSFPMSQFFTRGGQSIGVSASASVLPMNIQDWFPLGWTGWMSLQSKGLSRVFSNTTVQKHQLFGAQPSSRSNPHLHIWPLEKQILWLDGPLLAK